MCQTAALLFIVFCVVNASADSSGYRVGERFIEHPPIELRQSLTDGKDVLRPGRYRVRVRAGRIIVADAELRQVQLRAPCKWSVLGKSFSQPQVTLMKSGQEWRLDYRYRAWSCALTLREDKGLIPDEQLKLPESVKRRRTISSGIFDEPDAYELLTQTLEKRASDLKPCLVRAERRGPRLTVNELSRCMCSMSEVWRLPKVEKPLDIALRVVPYPFGLAFTHRADGRKADCRGWLGRGPIQNGVEVGGLWLEVLDEGYEP